MSKSNLSEDSDEVIDDNYIVCPYCMYQHELDDCDLNYVEKVCDACSNPFYFHIECRWVSKKTD